MQIQDDRAPCCGLSCSIFEKDGLLRETCTFIVTNRAFEVFISVCIVVSTAALMFENKFIGEGSTLQQTLYLAEAVVNISFSFEFILKLFSLGCHGYFSSFWNRLNFFIVMTSDLEMLLALYLTGPAVKILGAFRLLRVLRVLRFAAANFPGLQILIRTAGLAAGPLVHAMILVCASLLVLGIVGMQMFSGKMNSCSDPSVWTFVECVGLDAENRQRVWVPYDVNFDNIGSALVSQFVLASEDEWPLHMWAGASPLAHTFDFHTPISSSRFFHKNTQQDVILLFFIIAQDRGLDASFPYPV